MGLLLGSWFFSLIYVSDFVPVPCCFDYYRICSIFWNQEVWCFHLCFSFSSCLNYLESLLVLNNFPGSSEVIASACNAGDQGLIPGSGRSPGGVNGYPLHILAWRILWTEEPAGATVHGISKSQTQLRDFHFHILLLLLICTQLTPLTSKWPGKSRASLWVQVSVFPQASASPLCQASFDHLGHMTGHTAHGSQATWAGEARPRSKLWGSQSCLNTLEIGIWPALPFLFHHSLFSFSSSCFLFWEVRVSILLFHSCMWLTLIYQGSHLK